MTQQPFHLPQLGWNPFFEERFKPYVQESYIPARVAVQHRDRYVLYSEVGELEGEITGKMRYFAAGAHELPAVGDWVVVHARPEEKAATIVEILQRKSQFSRKVAGEKSEEQIVAANVDLVFLVTGLDANFNLRRIERYLVVAHESGAQPVVVLNKADLIGDVKSKINEVKASAGDIPIVGTVAMDGTGLDEIRSFLKEGITGALLGSSGVGKSTIINRLVGRELMTTREVRESDSRGRHATTRRELVLLPSGGLLIDTPGMRELQLWGGSEGLKNTFPDIEGLIAQCKFRNCSHTVEPNCAVRRALDDGTLDEKRYKNYQKMLREAAYVARKSDPVAERLEKERWKKITMDYKRGKLKGK